METMKKTSSVKTIKTLPLIIIIAMVVLSFTNLFGLDIAGGTIFIGVIFFFVNKLIEKQPFKGSGLDIKSIGADLKNKNIWLWIMLPLIVHAISIVISLLFLLNT